MIKPEIGMGITISVGSDRYPGTIIDISASGKTITFQKDSYKRIDSNGMSEDQEYEYSPNPNGEIEQASLRKNGRFMLIHTKIPIYVGEREHYYDFSF
jgi:hypothetical protein